jgi:hypothetical protein
MIVPIDVTLSPGLRELMVAFLREANAADTVPQTLTLLRNQPSVPTGQEWYFGTYTPEEIDPLLAEYETNGTPLLYSTDGLVFVIPQFNFVHELRGKLLELGEHGLLVLDHASGA